MRSSVFFLTLLLTVGLLSCQTSRNGKEKPKDLSAMEIDKIFFRFRDSSVPPPYHRSYTIDITANSSTYQVTDYSDVLAESTVEVNYEDWERLVQLAGGLQKPGEYEAEGASGTTGKTIQLFRGEEEVYRLYWDSLSDDKIKQNTLDFVSELKRVSQYKPIR